MLNQGLCELTFLEATAVGFGFEAQIRLGPLFVMNLTVMKTKHSQALEQLNQSESLLDIFGFCFAPKDEEER